MPQRSSRQVWPQSSLILVGALALIVAALACATSRARAGAHGPAATITVTNTDDSGPGSLRDAIATAAPGDTINFAVTGEINLTSGALGITKDLIISGPGASSLTVRRSPGASSFGIFGVGADAHVTISGLKISGGRFDAPFIAEGVGIGNAGTLTLVGCVVSDNSAFFSAAGIYNRGAMEIRNCQISGNRSGASGAGIHNDGTMSLSDSTVTDNAAGDSTLFTSTVGGGILNTRTLTITNSTISGNSVHGDGAGIFNNARLTIYGSTIARNTCRGDGLGHPPARGGGIFNNGPATSATLGTSIVAENHSTIPFALPANNDLFGAFTSNGHNLIKSAGAGSSGFMDGVNHDLVGRDPLLGLLQDNGGPTHTHALLCGSPAIDAGDDAITGPPLNLTTDQRGRARLAGAQVDIGAFETQVGEEQCQTLAVADAAVFEGDTGTRNMIFTVTLSIPTTNGVAFRYTTADGSAVTSPDYGSVNGSAFIAGGATTTTISVPVNGDTLFEPDETFTLTISDSTNAIITRAQAVGTITNDDSIPTLQFSSSTYQVNEQGPSALITVVRTGGTNGGLVVDYATMDDPAALPCAETNTTLNTAYARCDYTTTNGTLTFAVNQTEQTFAVPIINDAYVEQGETFKVVLSPPVGARLGPLDRATVTITDNDTGPAPNPIDSTFFFVRQHYLDFLSREPEAGEPWSPLLNNCLDVNNNPTCDRLTVSAAFFGSPEFRLRGYFIFRFYKLAFNRLPAYAEIIPDMGRVTGQTEAEVFQKKAAFASAFAQRAEFTNLYDGLSNTEYANALMSRYNRTQITTPDPAQPDGTQKVTLTSADLSARLDSGALTRAQVLRAVADSDQVFQLEFNAAFVATEYYGYLRRTPEPGGYQAWLNYLNANPADFRTMVNGFMNSQEYRLRFGRP